MEELESYVEEETVKYFDLEERTFQFAKAVRVFVKKIPRTVVNIEDSKQVVRSSGSIGANYIEANEALSKADFAYRIKICRKESKESTFWLRLIKETNGSEYQEECANLISESFEIRKIFASIFAKTNPKK
jgi:four helix bundle protein